MALAAFPRNTSSMPAGEALITNDATTFNAKIKMPKPARTVCQPIAFIRPSICTPKTSDATPKANI